MVQEAARAGKCTRWSSFGLDKSAFSGDGVLGRNLGLTAVSIVEHWLAFLGLRRGKKVTRELWT